VGLISFDGFRKVKYLEYSVNQKNVICFFLAVSMLLGCPPAQKTKKKKMPALFYVSGTFDTGKEPSFLVTSDFNLDGNADLGVVNSASHSFSILKGLGDGEFEDQMTYKTGADPICMAVADFNRDKYPDLAIINYADQNINIFLNNGLGRFLRSKQVLKPGKIPINLVAGDFDEDGAYDLAVTMRYHKVVVMKGYGNGRFAGPKSISVKGQPTGLIVGDYNNDKHKDIAVALAGSGNRGVVILWGDGKGKFIQSNLYRGGGQPLSIANIDANGDGYTDLVTTSNSLHALTTVMNNKDGTFTSLPDFASGEFPKFAAVEDFTGDNIPDLAITNSTLDKVSISLGKGDGTFTYPPIYHEVAEYPQGMVVEDFNKDGLPDIAVSNRDENKISILQKKNMVNPKPKAG